MYTKFGPKPSHPLGSRRLCLELCNFINSTCGAISIDESLQLKENQWLCTKCYEQESCLYAASIREKLEIRMEKLKLDEYSCESDVKGNIIDSPNLAEEKREYCTEKLNEVFKLFHMEPVIP